MELKLFGSETNGVATYASRVLNRQLGERVVMLHIYPVVSCTRIAS